MEKGYFSASLTRGQGPTRLQIFAFNCDGIRRADRGASRDRNRRPHRDNLARFVSRLHNGCAIGRAGKRV